MSIGSSEAGRGKLILPPLRRTAADAETFADRVHADQTDKAGYAYIRHLDRVANRAYWLAGKCPHWTHEDTDVAQQIAWLHDTVEDTWVTPRHLTDEGFSDKVVCGVALLTKQVPGVPYWRWIEDLVKHGNLYAILVKLADVEDNSDPERLALLPEETRERLLRKYEPAKEMLRAAARQKGMAGVNPSHPPHLECLGIYRPGLRTLPILPPRHIWLVSWTRYMPDAMRLSRARVVLRDLRKHR